MTQLAFIETDPETGQFTVVQSLGECDVEAYRVQMRELVTAKNDWDRLCNTILKTLFELGFLNEEGFQSGGYTYNDVMRAIVDYGTQAQEAAKDARKLAGRSYEPGALDKFLLDMKGTMVLAGLRALARIGEKGHDIIIDKQQAELLFATLLEPIKQQLLRDPERRRLITPIWLHYFGTSPDDDEAATPLLAAG